MITSVGVQIVIALPHCSRDADFFWSYQSICFTFALMVTDKVSTSAVVH